MAKIMNKRNTQLDKCLEIHITKFRFCIKAHFFKNLYVSVKTSRVENETHGATPWNEVETKPVSSVPKGFLSLSQLKHWLMYLRA